MRGIGFCGYYRLPGPAEVEEEELKDKKKKVELYVKIGKDIWFIGIVFIVLPKK